MYNPAKLCGYYELLEREEKVEIVKKMIENKSQKDPRLTGFLDQLLGYEQKITRN